MPTMRILLFAALCLGLQACSEDGKSVPAQSASQVPVAPRNFTPTANGLLTAQQVSGYRDASEALVQLQQKWSDRISVAQGQQKILILQGFEAARDLVCSKMGLAGWAEYRWIDSVATLPINKAIVDSAGIVLPTTK